MPLVIMNGLNGILGLSKPPNPPNPPPNDGAISLLVLISDAPTLKYVELEFRRWLKVHGVKLHDRYKN